MALIWGVLLGEEEESESPMPNLGCVRGRLGFSFSLLELLSDGRILDVRSSPGKTMDSIV